MHKRGIEFCKVNHGDDLRAPECRHVDGLVKVSFIYCKHNVFNAHSSLDYSNGKRSATQIFLL